MSRRADFYRGALSLSLIKRLLRSSRRWCFMKTVREMQPVHTPFLRPNLRGRNSSELSIANNQKSGLAAPSSKSLLHWAWFICLSQLLFQSLEISTLNCFLVQKLLTCIRTCNGLCLGGGTGRRIDCAHKVQMKLLCPSELFMSLLQLLF